MQITIASFLLVDSWGLQNDEILYHETLEKNLWADVLYRMSL